MNKKNKKIIVLIDAENISIKYLPSIIEEAKKYGDKVTKRAYADFNRNGMKKWKNATSNYGIENKHKSFSSTGKNSTDHIMVIDAMDILHKQTDVEVFVIVTNDSDFTSLAERIVKSGKKVIGMSSKNNASIVFKNACTKFEYLNVPNKLLMGSSQKRKENQINKFIVDSIKKDGKILLSRLKQEIMNKFPWFNEKQYNKSKFMDFVKGIKGILIFANDNLSWWATYK